MQSLALLASLLASLRHGGPGNEAHAQLGTNVCCLQVEGSGSGYYNQDLTHHKSILLPSCDLGRTLQETSDARRLPGSVCLQEHPLPVIAGLRTALTNGLEGLGHVAKGHVDGGADAQGQGPCDTDLAGLPAGVQQLVGEVGVGHRCDLLPNLDASLQAGA